MNLIVAVSKNFAIGKNNGLLFHLPSDLKYFKEKTLNKVVVMGDKTYFSLPKRPLKNRINIVLSFNKDLHEDGVIVVSSIKELFKELEKYTDDDVFICGGASVYNSLMDYCKYAYITKIDKLVEADTYINNIDNKDNWKIIGSSVTYNENDLDFNFVTYENTSVLDRTEINDK